LNPSRRDFLKTSSAALVGASLLSSTELHAQTLHLPLAIQLYSVRELLPTDFTGTLKKLHGLGYRQVEAAGYYNHSAAEVKQAMKEAGLNLVSSHHPSGDLQKNFDKILAFEKELGVQYIICASPGKKDPSAGNRAPMTLDDWKWNADELNKFGERVNAAGLKFGYHNHYPEFHKTDGVVPYDLLMSRTDPSKVVFEMDCGWVIVGGGDPIAYLQKYANRIAMLHVKDFKKSAAPFSETNRPAIAELGRGFIDYAPILKAAAKTGHIKHCFVEQEGFDMPPMESLKVDADYMRKLGLR
jgi:sugar phosphate isomerase/epimerase